MGVSEHQNESTFYSLARERIIYVLSPKAQAPPHSEDENVLDHLFDRKSTNTCDRPRTSIGKGQTL